MRTLKTSTICMILALTGSVGHFAHAEQKTDAKQSFLRKAFTEDKGLLAGLGTLIHPPQKDAQEVSQLPSTDTANRRSIRDVIRFDIENGSVYGLFTGTGTSEANSVARASGSSAVVGFGVERPIEDGVALNFEVFQNTDTSESRGSLLENTKAALRLRLKF
ncbi:hypothetical protein [Shimia marina]|uniref:Uncharacterized protein n=1 Tax=Shimia marina TaxID=321267 RepID=A0A0P1EQI9_9RHOB|nr:hypothetical protein [Shimia marina]CUH52163.1 hypothetical protein SHM7688_01603 [Shimia marina]SFE72736.1 hypothetical protein SAMN04488037_11736 [Shimia marina]